MGSPAEIQQGRITRLLTQVIWPATQPESAPLAVAISRLPGEPLPPETCEALTFTPFRVGEPWGGAWSTAWFKVTGRIPDSFDGRHVVARIDLGYRGEVGFGGEALVFGRDPSGRLVPRQGVNSRHQTVELSRAAAAGDPVELVIEAAANPGQREGPLEWPLLLPDYEGAPLYRLRRADLSVVDDAMTEVLYDWTILLELAAALGLEHRRSAEIIATLDEIALGFDLHDLAATIVAKRHRWLPLLERETSGHAHKVTAVGHAHIDSAWLWPIRETRRKCARTFSTALRLMEEHPDYVFVCSQAQQHAWMEQQYPSLFEEMRQRAAEGRLEPLGSMWVEPDTNLPSGESLCRQVIFGKRFFLDRYGIETVDCWLPDAFGYSGNLPQILRAGNVSRFFTQKLSWNDLDRFPHHTFWWEGIDGSRVLAHCPPTDTYNGDFTVGQLLAGDRRFAQHAVSDRSLYVYGHGDGGGGPTEEMLQRARRLRRLDPLPQVRLGTARSYFDDVEAEALRRDEEAGTEAGDGSTRTEHGPGPGGLPVWVGEMYFERHRAVQTTQARGKLGNRRSESLLREAELWSAAGLEGDEAVGAAKDLERAWRIVLLHQFHDILPGSSIHWVHADAQAAYGEVAELAGGVIARAAAHLSARVSRRTSTAAAVDGAADAAVLGSVLLLNAATRARSDVAVIDLGSLGIPGSVRSAVTPGGERLPLQAADDGTMLVTAPVPGCGWARLDLLAEEAPPQALEHPVEVEGLTLSNGIVSVTLDQDGLVTSLVDLVGRRETIAPGRRGNLFQLHHDLPNHFDAWDVDLGSFDRALDQVAGAEVEVVERGPVRAAIRVTRPIGRSSRLVQHVRLAAGSRRVEFATEVRWEERHRFLKVAFPVDVRAPHATYEIQFGHVERPTHANTSWDAARFEVPAQRWAALTDGTFGAALLNDCKHGYDVRAGVIRLSLLRGPGWPDPEADAGTHLFCYAVTPLSGGSLESAAVQAEALNLPLRVVPALGGGKGELGPEGALVTVDGALASAVKRADDDSGDLVVRLYEHRGTRSAATVSFAAAPARAARVDLLERELAEVPVTNGAVSLDLRPFELVTVRVSGG
ncbi:MAG TPA: glycoside hydrolase family 38 C-terminal domain-containing protein [Acidimicrobiales bacterium]|nr:glycoside hydrolase family 38 C-terminal domain-containing protein [Acidimicrobiales bacterium]